MESSRNMSRNLQSCTNEIKYFLIELEYVILNGTDNNWKLDMTGQKSTQNLVPDSNPKLGKRIETYKFSSLTKFFLSSPSEPSKAQR